jgi:hypothetical protein
VLEIRHRDVEVTAQDVCEVVFVDRALVDQQRTQGRADRSLCVESTGELLLGDQTFFEKDLSKRLMFRRRCLAGTVAGFDCHAVMLARARLLGNGDLPVLVGSLSRFVCAPIPDGPRLARRF